MRLVYSLPCIQKSFHGNSLCSIFQIFFGSVFHFALFSMSIDWRFFRLSSSADILLFICVSPLLCSLFSCPVWSGMVSLNHQGLNFEASKVSSHGARSGNALGASNSREVQSFKCSFSSSRPERQFRMAKSLMLWIKLYSRGKSHRECQDTASLLGWMCQAQLGEAWLCFCHHSFCCLRTRPYTAPRLCTPQGLGRSYIWCQFQWDSSCTSPV